MEVMLIFVNLSSELKRKSAEESAEESVEEGI